MSRRAARSAAALLLVACGPSTPGTVGSAAPAPTLVGRETCARCHDTEARLWEGSDHDRAMDVATEATVLGDFDGAELDHFGQTFRFRRDGPRFLVDTPGADGAPATFEIAWVFGVDPLQQYLVPFPDGRVQALAAAWDTRPAEQGGQRWFHMYPDEPIPPGDELHWTGPNQNWNHMCADCHSTALVRGYDPRADRFDTTWAEIDVSCEACHGPGSRHVAWAEGRANDDATHGLVNDLHDRSGGKWEIDPQTGNARRSAPRTEHTEVETCARCHARRSPIHEGVARGASLLDDFRPALLEETLYCDDGQILDEVYVYGSFLQSRMYHMGVTCSDCHDPHTAEPLFAGNSLCARCHAPSKYDAPSHHHHAEGGPGSACVDCHMPTRTYMVVDPRRDHSLRVPRPDLSVAIGTPNACRACHAEGDAARSDEVLADDVRGWFPSGRWTQPHWGTAMHALRAGDADSLAQLVPLALDPEASPIVRATVTAEIGRRSDESWVQFFQGLAGDADPLVRAAALGALESLPPTSRLSVAFPLVEDAVRLVRVEAARVMAEMPAGQILGGGLKMLDDAFEEYEQSLRVTQDRAETQHALGLYFTHRERAVAAEAAYRRGLDLDPRFVPNYANLAEVLRERGDEAAARAVLERGIAATNDAALHNSLGMALVRAGDKPGALRELALAADLRPQDPFLGYAYAVALRDSGDTAGALGVLNTVYERFPRDRRVVQALATYYRDDGERDLALRFARELAALAPGDEGARALVEELTAEEGR